jgi:hypothetical protein
MAVRNTGRTRVCLAFVVAVVGATTGCGGGGGGPDYKGACVDRLGSGHSQQELDNCVSRAKALQKSCERIGAVDEAGLHCDDQVLKVIREDGLPSK